MKLKHFSLHNTDNIPEHILEEIEELSKRFAKAINPLLCGVDANIILAAYCFAHAGMIKHFVSDEIEHLEAAAGFQALSFLRNVEVLSGGKFKKYSTGD